MQGQEIIRKRKRSTQKVPDIGTSSSLSFKNRQQTVNKKASELSKLCDVDVCVICYRRDGTLYTWPENRNAVREIAMKYKRSKGKQKSKKSLNLAEFSEKIQQEEEKKSCGNVSKFQSWNESLDGYSRERLIEIDGFLVDKLQRLQERLECLKQRKKQEQNTLQIVESEKDKEFNKIPPPETVDQRIQNKNSSEILRNSVSNLVGSSNISDLETLLFTDIPEDGGFNNSGVNAIIPLQKNGICAVNRTDPTVNVAATGNFMTPPGGNVPVYFQPSAQGIGTSCSYNLGANAKVPLQNQGNNGSDMNRNNEIAIVNRPVPVANNNSMLPPACNIPNYCQPSNPQPDYQTLSEQVIGTSCSNRYFHPVQTVHGSTSSNNNFASWGTLQQQSSVPMLQGMRNGVSQLVNNSIVLSNGGFQVGYSPLMETSSFCQGVQALQRRQNQQPSGFSYFGQ